MRNKKRKFDPQEMPLCITWDGTTTRGYVSSVNVMQDDFIDYIKSENWQPAAEILDDEWFEFVTMLVDESMDYSPLHYAAYKGAPIEFFQKMLEKGALRTLENKYGERAIDIAKKNGHNHLLEILEPMYQRDIPFEILERIQENFYKLIRSRIIEIISLDAIKTIEQEVIFPKLAHLLEKEEIRVWFPIPGMYGGFYYWFEGEGSNTKLIAKSWCRVWGGSEQCHEITPEGSKFLRDC
ncbi:hypothetical protein [Candidatus Uabimicrobium sp. HlEnr_7]|uniref:hypothetical protein n=1 Tax=Candidatus Uabimicrobium helgolandensis TaxID=3095367 RepID=UPI003557CBE2